jgi:RNA:NAD 2'-phosphotransferase (TPT1/KptA family)
MTIDDFHSEMNSLIGSWCDRRALKLLATVLPHHVGNNGLTDGWADLATAFKTVRSQYRHELQTDELDRVIAAQQFVEDLLSR